MIYDKTCGRLRLTVSPPHPNWVTIMDMGGTTELRLLEPEDLRDLRHLIDRALEAIDASKPWQPS